MSATGGLGAVVGFFLPWLVFVAATQTGCRAQVVQVEIYNLYGAAVAIGNAGDTAWALACVAALCAVAILITALLSARRPVLFRIRLQVAASLVALAALGLFAALAVSGRVTLSGKTFIYSAFLGFGPGYWVTTGSLALALVGGAVLHAAARPRRQRAPGGEIALALLGIVALVVTIAAAIVVRPAPYPSLTCARQGNEPVSGGGAVYITSADGVYALDATNGRVQWRCRNPLGGVVTKGAPALAEGSLFVATRDGYVYAIRAEDATILWRADVGGRGLYVTQTPSVAPIVADGLVFGVNGAGQVYALRASDGAHAWSSDAALLPAWTVATPLLADGTFIYPAIDMGGIHLTARDERTGQPRWQSPDTYMTAAFALSNVPMQVDKGVVYDEEGSARNGGLYLVARSVANGVARWSYTLSSSGAQQATSAFNVADGAVYLERRQQATPSVVALRADDGAVMWSALAPDVVSSQATQAIPPTTPMISLVSQTPQVTPTQPPTPTPPATQASPPPLMTLAPSTPQPTPPTQAPPTTQGGQALVTLAAGGGSVYVAVSSVLGGALDTMYRFDARHGAVRWRYDFAHSSATPTANVSGEPTLALTGDSLYLLDLSGAVAAFDAHTGSVVWQFNSTAVPTTWSPVLGSLVLGSLVLGAPPVSGSATGLLYVATSNLYAINPVDGAVRWQFTPDKPTTPYAQSQGGYPPFVPSPIVSPPMFAP